MLAFGNYWYNAYSMKNGDAQHLRTAYKFYHPVLTEHVRNVYAANGLGLICAAKNEFDAAREIFSKVISFFILIFPVIYFSLDSSSSYEEYRGL